DHSLPTSKPTRFVIVRTPSVVSADVALGHLLPVRPVVVPAVPDAERVANPFVPEQRGKLPIAFAQRIVAADRENDVLAPERLQAACVVLVRDELGGIRRVHVLVGVAAREPPDIV